MDFEDVIDNVPDGSLLFIDPPYFNADQDKFYQHFFSKNDHFRLAECLQRNTDRLKLFITYDNTPEIRKLYNWMTEMHDKEWNYCIQRTDDQKNGSIRKGERYKGKEDFLGIPPSFARGRAFRCNLFSLPTKPTQKKGFPLQSLMRNAA